MSFIYLYGRAGTGKTTLACSMTKLGYKVHLIDIDDKAGEMVNIQSLIKSGKVVVDAVKSRLVEQTFEERIKHLTGQTPKIYLKNKEPKGYLEFCGKITAFEQLMITEEKTAKDTVLVIDSFTILQEHMRRLFLHLNKKDKFTFDEWDMWKTNIEEMITALRRLQGYFKHVIVISHEMMDRDEIIGKIEIMPMVDGSMKYKMSNYFSEVYHCYVDTRGGKANYMVATKPRDRADARTSRDLKEVEEADFAILFKEEMHNGNMQTV
jgi:archaellum biogenesis ATPase FlaH